MQVSKVESSKSITPLLLFTFNDPAHTRMRIGQATVLCLIPGTAEDGCEINPQGMLRVVVDELQFVYDQGLVVHDAHAAACSRRRQLGAVGMVSDERVRQDASIEVHAKLLAFISDYRGLIKFMSIPGSPAYHCCLKCWKQGYRIGSGKKVKTVYTGDMCMLCLDDPFRQEMTSVHTAVNGGQPWPVDVLPPRRRTAFELRYGARRPWPMHMQPRVSPRDLWIYGKRSGPLS